MLLEFRPTIKRSQLPFQPGFACLSMAAPLPSWPFEIVAPGLILLPLLLDSKQTLLSLACCVPLGKTLPHSVNSILI